MSRQELGRLRQALFLGLARQPPAVPEQLQALLASAPGREPALSLLALAGQRQRFERPAAAPGAAGIPEAARHLHADARPIIPQAVRRLLLRLANGAEKQIADTVVRAAVRRALSAGFRLHPFDLPRLIGHIKGDALCLGLAERAYLALADRPGKTEVPSLIYAEITAENWTELPKAQRTAFLQEERRKDPVAARALLEAVFKSETAAVRTELLSALFVGLSSDDLPFLEAQSSDRSEAVRELVVQMIASIPGTPAYAARLAEAAQCFSRPTAADISVLDAAGLANAGGLVFTPPKLATTSERRNLFAGLSAAEVAAAAAATIDELLAAVPSGGAIIRDSFFTRASRDNDGETMARLELLYRSGSARRSLAQALSCLAHHLSGPISPELGSTLLDGPELKSVLEARREATTPTAMKDDGTLIFTAVVLPPELQLSFQEAIAELHPVATRSARDFSDLVLALDALKPTQR
jgi:hypothetical protein